MIRTQKPVTRASSTLPTLENITMDGHVTAQEIRSEEVLKFFIQLINMTKHMVDEILPDLMFFMDKSMIDTIISQCDEFDASFHVYMKLCGVLSKKNLSRPPVKQPAIENSDKNEVTSKVTVDPTSSDDRGNNSKCINKTSTSQISTVTDFSNSTNEEDLIGDNVWKILIDEVKTKFNQSELLKEFYYCGLCNVRCYDENTWPAHLKGKPHTLRSARVSSMKMVCNTCGFHIISENEHIVMIMESQEHQSFDDLIIRKSLPLKTPVQSPVKNSSKEVPNSKKSDVMSKSDRTTSEVLFKGTVVCSSFFELTADIQRCIENRKHFTACFCRPCDVVCKSKNSWLQHINFPKHVSLMKNKSFNNVLTMCAQCDFGILASKAIARSYMCYHIENCHQQCTDNIKDDDYMVVQEITPKVEKKRGGMQSGGSSKQGSFKGSTDSMNHSRRNSVGAAGKNDLKSSVRDDDIERSETPTSYQSLAAQMKSMKELRGSSQGTSRSGSRASLRSPELKEGSLKKYLDDVCLPPKEENSVFSKYGNLKKQKPFPISNSPEESTGIDDYSQFSGRSTPYSGRSQPSSVLGSKEQRKNVQPENNLQQDLSRPSSSACMRGSQSTVNRSGSKSSNDSVGTRSPDMDMEVDDSYRDGPRSLTGAFQNKPKSSPRPLAGRTGHHEPPKFMVSDETDIVALFIVMLRHKESKFLANKTFKPFSALCLLCPIKTFRDSFEWLDHVMTHSSNDTENEVDCTFCNSHMYGNVADIRERLIFHDEHMRIDRLMKY